MSTFFDYWRTCRICHDQSHNSELVKYNVRHYAHPACALRKWGAAFFQMITPWQATQFPYFIAKRAGVAAELEARCNEYRATIDDVTAPATDYVGDVALPRDGSLGDWTAREAG
jgi:hypothetical protein